MSLTAAQQTALGADIAANANLINGTAINALPHTADNAFAVAAWYSGIAVPDYFVWRTNVPIADLFDQVTWANYTPVDAPDATVIWSNRSLAAQGKQFNLQTMLTGRGTFDASKLRQRAGLNDATTALPTGAAGASLSGGWANILPILRRQAKWVEKLFAVATTGVGNNGADARGATTNPDLMGYEGDITVNDVRAVWGI